MVFTDQERTEIQAKIDALYTFISECNVNSSNSMELALKMENILKASPMDIDDSVLLQPRLNTLKVTYTTQADTMLS